MNILEKILIYVALGLSVVALVLSNSSSSSILGAGPSSVSCSGRAYCTAWSDILFRSASSTDKIDANQISATGTVAFSGATNLSGTATLSSTTYVNNAVLGGAKATLATGATASITAAQFCSTNSYYEWLPTSASAQLTLPSAAQASCLTSSGYYKEIIYKDISPTASSTLFVAGASSTIVVVNATSTDGTASTTLNGGGYARLVFLNASSSDPTSGMTVLIDKFK